jgi:hypothetical protein
LCLSHLVSLLFLIEHVYGAGAETPAPLLLIF